MADPLSTPDRTLFGRPAYLWSDVQIEKDRSGKRTNRKRLQRWKWSGQMVEDNAFDRTNATLYLQDCLDRHLYRERHRGTLNPSVRLIDQIALIGYLLLIMVGFDAGRVHYHGAAVALLRFRFGTKVYNPSGSLHH